MDRSAFTAAVDKLTACMTVIAGVPAALSDYLVKVPDIYIPPLTDGTAAVFN